MQLEKFSNLILKLIASAVELPQVEYNARIVTLLSEVVHFDAAWWGWSSFPSGRVMIVNAQRFYLPPNFEAAFKTVAQFDPFIRHGRNLPVFAIMLSPHTASVADEYRAFTDRFGIEAIMNGHCRLEQSSAYNFFMSLYRGAGKPHFGQEDADGFRIILRHVEQALSLSLRAELQARAGSRGEAALLDESGQIVRATPGFEPMLQAEGLPLRRTSSILRQLIHCGGLWRGTHLTLEAELYAPGLTRIRVARSGLWHQLSTQERRVAELLLAGRSAREIADLFHVSTNTVRNQIATIYRKLGVDSRIALLQRLSPEL